MNRGAQTLATRVDEVFGDLIDQGHFRMQCRAHHIVQPRHIGTNRRENVFFCLMARLIFYNHLCVQCLLTIAKFVVFQLMAHYTRHRGKIEVLLGLGQIGQQNRIRGKNLCP